MKVILSRKGFDSSTGGYASPILPDVRMISLPIPSDEDSISYSELRFDKNKTYYDLIKELKNKIKYCDEWRKLNKETKCHLDPDIYKRIMDREEHWKPCFGQIGGVQTHLENQGVKIGDLFLFFGWFKKTEYYGFCYYSSRNFMRVVYNIKNRPTVKTCRAGTRNL